MPKVETEYTLTKGTHHINKHDKHSSQNYVSNPVGNIFDGDNNVIPLQPAVANFDYSSKRIKRDVESDIEPDIMNYPIKHRRKVKIIRRRPRKQDLINQTLDNSIVINREIELWDDHRTRVIVTKKRRLNPIPNTVNNRRRVIVTKKRLLKPTSTSTFDDTYTEPVESTEGADISITPTNVAYSIITENFYHILPETDFESEESSSDFPPDSIENILTETSKYSVTESIETPQYEIYTTLLTEQVTSSYTRNKTYTYVVTRVHENEQLITSTTSVKADIKTETMTLTHTLTLTKPITFSDGPTLSNTNSNQADSVQRLRSLDLNHGAEEGRYNVATRVMSNGVEVIVAGDKSATSINTPHFLGYTEVKSFAIDAGRSTETMKGLLPRDVDSRDEIISSSIHLNQFITKTLLTTYTYLTTYLQGSTTTVSSNERVIANTATEERNMVKIVPTPTVGITLTENPNLAVGVFHTTYTYLNTILDGKTPSTITSRRTVANTVTAPDDYLSLLQPSEPTTAILDTNTYYSTVALTKTVIEGNSEKVIKSSDILTQVIITESTPPRGMSVMTSYIALDVEDLEPSAVESIATTDVVKTHYVTYTYYNTYLEHGNTVVRTNVSTSTDIVTEKLYLHLKRTQTDAATQKIIKTSIIENETVHDNDMQIFATKTYLTTFTYFTTLLNNAPNDQTKTVINSHTRVVENVVVEPNSNSPSSDEPSRTDHTIMATLTSKQKTSSTETISSMTVTEETEIVSEPSTESKIDQSKSSPSVITGSTIIFFDDDEIDATPVMEMLTSTSDVPKTLKSEAATKITPTKTKPPVNILTTGISASSSTIKTVSTAIHTLHLKGNDNAQSNKTPANKTSTKPNKPELQDLLGSLSINSFTALRPVINAMADMINSNLNVNRRNDTVAPATSPKPRIPFLAETQSTIDNVESKNRSPIYIPVGGLSDDRIEAAESQNYGQFSLNVNGGSADKWPEQIESRHKNHIIIGKPTHESPLLNGGIHISPGEVITANSDVIVGRPAVVGPRIPIDTNKYIQQESSIGMHPPPIPIGSHTSALYGEHSLDKDNYGSKRDDYFGPPPVAPQVPFRRKPNLQQKYRDNLPSSDKYPPRRERPYLQNVQALPSPPTNFQDMNRYKINGPSIIPLHYGPSDNKDSGTKHNYVISTNEGNTKVERLPQQDNYGASINIFRGEVPPTPVYEHSSHFDDPSPIPEPENGSGFVGVQNYNNDAALSASSNSNNVHGSKFNIENNLKVTPAQYESLNKGEYYGNREVIVNTSPTKFGNPNYSYNPEYQPTYNSKPNVIDNHSANIGGSYVSSYPPGQIVKHVVTEGIVLDAPLDNEPISTSIHAHRPNLQTVSEILPLPHRPNDFNKIINAKKPSVYPNTHEQMQIRPPNLNKPIRNMYNDQAGRISQYMTPPPRIVSPIKSTIPVYSVPIGAYNPRPHTPQEMDFYRDNIINGNYHNGADDEEILEDTIIDQHKEDDIANEEGEVVQESNPRPLFPGEVPVEIIKASSSLPTNTNRPMINTQTEAGANLLNIYTSTPSYDMSQPNLPFKKTNIQVNPRPFSRPNNNFGIKDTYAPNSPQVPQVQPPVMMYPHWKPPQIKYGTANGPHAILLAKPNIVKPNVYYQNDKRIYGFGNKVPIINTPTFTLRPNQGNKQGMPNVNTQYTFQQVSPNKTQDIKQQISSHNTDSESDSLIKILHAQYPVIVPQKNVSVSEQPTVTGMPPTPSKNSDSFELPNNNNFMDEKELNTGEVTSQNPDMRDQDNENQSEIFDFKESTHPHNLGSLRPHIFNNRTTINEPQIFALMPPPPSNEYAKYGTLNTPHMSDLATNISKYDNKLLENSKTTTDMTQVYIPKPSEDMKPPPAIEILPSVIHNEEVVGLSPPPPMDNINRPIDLHSAMIQIEEQTLNSKYKDAIRKPTYPVTVKPMPPYVFETPNSEKDNIFGSTSNKPSTDAPDYIIDDADFITQRPTTTDQTEVTTLSNESTNSLKENFVSVDEQEMHINIGESHAVPAHTTKYNVLNDTLDSGSESIKTYVPAEVIIQELENFIKTNGSISKNVTSINIIPLSKPLDESVINTTPIKAYEQETIFNTKTSSSSDTSSMTTNQNINVTSQSPTPFKINQGANGIKSVSVHSSKPIIPTRYITHTQTLTVTSTKTTVIKSQGSPPSTLTLVLTKTQTSTIVDTVTEIHTLVRPTSIIETITTTINSKPMSTALPYPHHTPVSRPDVKKIIISSEDDELNEFIINDEDTDTEMKNYSKSDSESSENESIFVVLTDKNMHGNRVKPTDMSDIMNKQENLANEVNRVLLGGVLIDTPPHLQAHDSEHKANECRPDCKSSYNELCQRLEGIMRCVCRPGFARMFPDRPCKPTYTYTVQLGLARNGKEELRYTPALADRLSPVYIDLAAATHEGLHRMIMQSDLRDVYHGLRVTGFQNTTVGSGVINNFFIQLSENTDEHHLKNIMKNYLRRSNFSLGGTEIFSARQFENNLLATDFNECLTQQFHDCSENAQCFNLRGTYTCSCKEGFADMSANPLYPGRTCSAELVGCEKCHYHGTCYSRGEDQMLCECFQWYAGESCHINLKVLLIALVTLGTIFCTLLLICIILACVKKRQPNKKKVSSGISFLQQRSGGIRHLNTTLDKRAMIQDTSSEGSQSDSNTLPYIAKKSGKNKSSACKKIENQIKTELKSGSYDQQDRSLTVMIPRAKYHPHPTTSPLLNIDALDRRKSTASSNEAKLLSYLDVGVAANKPTQSRKNSNQSTAAKAVNRKPSIAGALVSAGFEVSATVVGTEADRSENATLIHKIRSDFLSTAGSQSQFTTIGKSHSHEDLIDPMGDWLDVTPRAGELTVSEARSYDETTIQPMTKTMRSIYDSKPPSNHHNNDEANTMAERDLGSTFLLPHTHLYKPDRGSDISGFDSL